MKALVTGVGGFCGPHLISRLRRQRDFEIVGLDRMAIPSSQSGLDRYAQCDITQAAEVDSAINLFKPDWLFHLAGIAGNWTGAALIYEVNLIGTVHVLDAVQRIVPGCRVLLVGSFAEYGGIDASSLPVVEETVCRPIGAYGISKYAATLAGMDYARRFGASIVVVRPSNIVGPGVPASLVVGAMLARAKNALTSSHPVLKVGDFDSERDFIAVTDAVDAYVRLMEAGAFGEVFNICSGRPYSIRRIAELLVANSTRPIQLDFDRDLVPPSPIRCLYGSYEKAGRAIGFRPLASMEDTLKAAWCAEMGLVCESRC